MPHFFVATGETVVFSKTVGESDVYLFAGITGDFSRNHVNEAYMQGTPFGRRIAHGALLVGFMSTASSLLTEQAAARGVPATPVSLGYDRIRFVKPVFLQDTVTVRYTVEEIDAVRQRSRARIEVTNQHGEVVAVAEHLLKWVVPS
jgi:3-hydroxybutyryl-CoA dehydratase